MRLSVDPTTVRTAADAVRDLGGRVVGLELGAVGALVAAGMPGSTSAGLSGQTTDRLRQELSFLAGDLAGYAERLRCAADEYAAAEQAVTDRARGAS